MYKSLLAKVELPQEATASENIDEQEDVAELPSLSSFFGSSRAVSMDGDSYIRIYRQCMKEISASLDSGGLSDHQKTFCESMLKACIRSVYGDDFYSKSNEIMERNGWDKNVIPKDQILIACPRRFGKTYAVSFFCASILIALPSARIAVFSPSKRQSIMMKETILKFIKQVDLGRTLLYRVNEEKIILRNGNDERELRAYPCNVASTKGSGGNIIIAEECSRIPPAFFYEVICPLYTVEKASLICISTLTSADNFYTELLEMKDEVGAPFFETFIFQLACEACIKAGKAAECNHKMSEIPQWQSSRKQKRVRAMMSGNMALLEQEAVGLASVDRVRAFNQEKLMLIFTSKKYTLAKPPYNIYVGVDPSGGGPSRFAIASICQCGTDVVIVGLESIQARVPEQYAETLKNHLKMLHRRFPGANLVVAPEANLGFEHLHISRYVQEAGISKTIVIRDKKGSIGLYTSPASKEAMFVLVKDLVDTLQIKIIADIVNCSGTVKNTLEQFKTEMRKFSIAVTDPKRIFSKQRKTYSGKHAGTDDMVMAFLISNYAKKVFKESSRYHQYV